MELQALKAQCKVIRRDIISMLAMAGSGHPGGSLSAVEILAALYGYKMNVDAKNPSMPERDRFVLSKGHAAPALYAVLANNGFFSKEEYKGLRKLGGMLQGHPDRNKCPGVEASTGSLGQGVSVAAGMAKAAKYMGSDVNVYTVLGDGEIAEGEVWEAFLFASHYKLDNLCVIIDLNGLQIDGRTVDVMNTNPVNDKMAAFGFNVIEIDGHSFDDMEAAFAAFRACEGKPTAILMKTIKGKGVSYMTDNAEWHGKAPNDAEYEVAMAELRAQLAELEAAK